MILKARMIKPALIVLLLASVAAASWTARGWLEDSKELAVLKAQRELAAEIRADMAQVSRAVDERLQGLRANERIIDRGIIREIQQPVYRNVCVPADSDAFRLLNDLAAGQASREPDDQSTDDAATAD